MEGLKRVYKYLSPKYQNIFLDYPVVPRPRNYGENRANPYLERIVSAQRDEYRDRLESFMVYAEDLMAIREASEVSDSQQPSWNNGFLPGLDILGIYGMISTLRPQRYYEVGSGNSTKVAHYAKRMHNPQMEIVSIDPYPRAEIDGLSDRIIRQPFENIDLTIFDSLSAGDIVFIDNSHRILPNSDSMVFFMELLPALKPGVIIHIHDIYTPYDYPQFMCDRYYSELYGLGIYLLGAQDKVDILLPNYYISEDPELKSILHPLWDRLPDTIERHGGSFWFTKR